MAVDAVTPPATPPTGAPTGAPRGRVRFDRDHPRYEWVALSNTALGTLMATVNSSIVIISLPAIFRGNGIDPLGEGDVIAAGASLLRGGRHVHEEDAA